MFFSALLLCGCGRQYNYGVHRDDPQRVYRDEYHYKTDEQYRFETILFEEPKVEIRHLSHPHKRDDILKSTLQIDHPMTNVHSVLLEHRSTDGKLIKPSRVTPLRFSSSDLVLELSKTYTKADLPKKVIQVIQIELNGTNGIIKLQYRFPLKYKLHYTQWDVIMEI